MSDTVLDHVVACIKAALMYDPNLRMAPVALLWPDEGAQWKQIVDRIGEHLPVVALGEYDAAARCGPVYWVRWSCRRRRQLRVARISPLYTSALPTCTLALMDVAISILRADLSTWIERARAGEEIVVTDRGTPVARLLAVDTAPLLDQLMQRGVLGKQRRPNRPAARGASRVQATGPVADLVGEQRR